MHLRVSFNLWPKACLFFRLKSHQGATTTSFFCHQNVPFTWSNLWIQCTGFVCQTQWNSTLILYKFIQWMTGKYQQFESTLDKPWTTGAIKGLMNLFVLLKPSIFYLSSSIHLSWNNRCCHQFSFVCVQFWSFLCDFRRNYSSKDKNIVHEKRTQGYRYFFFYNYCF